MKREDKKPLLQYSQSEYGCNLCWKPEFRQEFISLPKEG